MNVEMPTIVGILTFISMINATFETLNAKKKKLLYFFFHYFSLYEQLRVRAQLSFITSRAYILITDLPIGTTRKQLKDTCILNKICTQERITICILGNSPCFCCRLHLFSKLAFSQTTSRNTIGLSNGLYPDQKRRFSRS